MNNKKDFVELANQLNLIDDHLKKVNENIDAVLKKYDNAKMDPYSSNDYLVKLEQNIEGIRSNIKDVYIPEINKEING